jgi:hypothetical protein
MSRFVQRKILKILFLELPRVSSLFPSIPEVSGCPPSGFRPVLSESQKTISIQESFFSVRGFFVILFFRKFFDNYFGV